MIKIQFDHQTFSMHRFGGISRYFASIQESLSKENDFSFSENFYDEMGMRTWFCEIEVIGNIFENPSILEAE